jgi:hypothetical protein
MLPVYAPWYYAERLDMHPYGQKCQANRAHITFNFFLSRPHFQLFHP